MFRFLAALSLMGSLASPGLAEFRKFELPQPPDLIIFDCIRMKATDQYAPDPDPVYKIVVTMAHDNGEFKALSVIHHHASGMRSDRSVQYDHAMIWQTQNKAEWYWKGYRGNGTMVGEVWADQTGWFYVEDRFEHGVKKWEMVAKCHLT